MVVFSGEVISSYAVLKKLFSGRAPRAATCLGGMVDNLEGLD